MIQRRHCCWRLFILEVATFYIMLSLVRVYVGTRKVSYAVVGMNGKVSGSVVGYVRV
ncbi:hypothetical protein C8Q75DRAFT_773628 [Abortiporus biennis]|nr:hypothetical protein C8Q75DRAFT_773628 [Abortiporus biennis]